MFAVYMSGNTPLTGIVPTEYVPQVGNIVTLTDMSTWEVVKVIWFIENSQATVYLTPYSDD